MSNGVKASKPFDTQTPAQASDATFRALLAERATLLSDVRSVERQLMRKCVDEGWDDCVRLNYSLIHRRVK